MNNLLAAAGNVDLSIKDQAVGLIPGADTVSTQGAGGAFANLISGFLELAIFIAGLLLLLYLVWGAIEWITAGGDSGKIEGARNRMLQAIVGIIVLAATIAIFNLVQTFLNVTLLDFGGIGSGGGGGGGGNHQAYCPCGNGEWASPGNVGSGGDGNCYECKASGA